MRKGVRKDGRVQHSVKELGGSISGKGGLMPVRNTVDVIGEEVSISKVSEWGVE